MNMIGLLLVWVGIASALRNPNTTTLNEWPMIMAHDAATTYLIGSAIHQINRWAKTQPDGGTTQLLNCGARAFDWRPLLDGSKLIMHHGSINIDHDMSSALGEMVTWSVSNGKGVEDLIIIGITDCGGGAACTTAVSDLLSLLKIPFIQDCSLMRNLTVAKAFSMSSNGIIAINSCWEENYDSSVVCYSTSYTCYDSSKNVPFNHMLTYLQTVTNESPPNNGYMYTHQALWQEDKETIAIGELHLSDLLLDESRSALNAWVTNEIKIGALNHSRINMIEVNNVCDGGLALLEQLRAI